MEKVKFGILSTAKIGREKVIPAIQSSNHCEVTTICSRSLESAQQLAAALNIPKAYGNYEEMLADSDIDAVYIPLPNHLHVQWSINALLAGKHVLCEKPIGLDCNQVQKLLDVASHHPDLKVMEAFMFRHHPQWTKTKQLINSGTIGELTTIQSFFSYFNNDPKNIRNKADIGGGGLMDIGCYNISLSRFLFDAEPNKVIGFMDKDPVFSTDRLFAGMMDFQGKISTFTCSTQLSPYQRVNILGTKGRIEILIPFNAPADQPCTILLQQDKPQGDNSITTIELDICDQYALQADLFASSILKGTPVPTPLTDAHANMYTLEKLIESAETGEWTLLTKTK